ncbi:cupin domain-containing protein [Chromobacterium violaceum]|uniref:Nif11 domain/cupin domain protein n=1 Tax=Chromobacterium violaceum TaxID=536 RepID=A0AAX2M7P5_CHRVL|nr:cupin domain-containing protein [Chromobacterium violaceum]OLZ77235.1 phosphoribosylaminoimidazole carboxylase [Chromobacterium violaceum]STB63823.1 nif11 domain/cupin domain protein [Chromobacterium violaceum]SUX32390.1 nif11 domain/cupin domain protein [Chromobacterium violaceum]
MLIVKNSLFDNIPSALLEEWCQEIFATRQGLRMKRIVSNGHCSPDGFWYDQDEHEWVSLLSGAAILEFAEPDQQMRLEPGDAVMIPAHRRHRVAWTDPEQRSVWLAVFFPA